MSDTSANNKRIAKNTVYLYVRMLFSMAISLYTSRVVLDKLGVEDFGVYNVVAGFVGMLGFFSSSLANVTQRFLTIELGRNDFVRARQIFNQHLLLYIGLILLVLIIGETLGLYFVKSQLVIPEGRLNAALWAYHFALLSLVFTLLGIVYNSAIIAHEDMKVYSYVGIIEGVAKLAIAFIISITSFDRLIFYAFLLFVVVAVIQTYYGVFCHRRYSECSYMWYWNRKTVGETASFISWNFVGTIIYMLKDQGLNILLNIFCGPVVNAARAISYQVNSAISNFNNNFVTSVQPQIVKSYASGDFAYMNKLFFNMSRYSLLLMWALCFPVMLYMDFLLGLWLKEVPTDTGIFTIWILIDSILATMTNAPWIITMATGCLKKYVLYCNSVLLLIFPISYIALFLGTAPVSVFIIIVIVRIIQILGILFYTNRQIHYGLKTYCSSVVLPVVVVVLISLPLGWGVNYVLGALPFVSIILIFLLTAAVIWLLGITASERSLALRFISDKIRR